MHTYQARHYAMKQSIVIDTIAKKIVNVLNVKASCKKYFKQLNNCKFHQNFKSSISSITCDGLSPNDKCAVHSTSLCNNKGSAVVEAVCIVPIMLFAFLAFYSMGQIFVMENQIYQAAVNTADSLAEYAYCAEISPEELPEQILGLGLAYTEFHHYLGDNYRVNQYVKGKKYGIILSGSQIMNDEGYIEFNVTYRVSIPVPILNHLSTTYQIQIRRKAYTGYVCPEKELKESDIYVYVTEHGTVYHMTKSCRHLRLTIIPVSKYGLEHNYKHLSPCEYCGRKSSEVYYVTAYGDRYHTSRQCSGLKRSIKRVRLSEVKGLGPCRDCCN